MDKRLLHTPEGVRDIYDEECRKKLAVQHIIRHLFHTFGYHDIQTPTFEFFDIFSKERGSVASKNLYKFFDREGNTLVLRPDMTPSIARAVSKYYMDETMTVRFCYSGSTFINHSELQGKLKESTQMGAELLGDESPEADAEMISLAANALKQAGVREFQVEIGEMDFFKGIVEEAGMNPETEGELRRLIEIKNYFGIEELLAHSSLDASLKEILLNLPGLFGSYDILQKAESMAGSARSRAAIERLKKLYRLLEEEGLEQYISFDLGMISMYHYYTGIIFKVYTYGTGDAVATGGRYDRLLGQFGKDSAAVGFGLNLDQLMIAMSRQKLAFPEKPEEYMILYEASMRGKALCFARTLRDKGIHVRLDVRNPACSTGDYLACGKKNKAAALYYFGSAANDGVIEVADFETETWRKITDYDAT